MMEEMAVFFSYTVEGYLVEGELHTDLPLKKRTLF
jgi:hypothetical protein